MPKPIDLTTIGAKFGFAYETTAGTQPTTFTNIPGIKSVPEFNPEPNMGETTSLNNEEYTSYIPLLKDLGGALAFGIGMSQKLLTDWNTMCDTTATNEAEGKRTWFCVYHPGLDKSIIFPGKPTKLGMPAMEVNAVWDTNVYVAPIEEPKWIDSIQPTN